MDMHLDDPEVSVVLVKVVVSNQVDLERELQPEPVVLAVIVEPVMKLGLVLLNVNSGKLKNILMDMHLGDPEASIVMANKCEPVL